LQFFTQSDSVADGTTVPRMIITDNGRVGINTASPTDHLTVVGSFTTGNYGMTGWTHASDMRLKTNITIIPKAVEKTKSLNGYYYTLIADPSSQRQIDFMAQGLQKIVPEAVSGKERDIEKVEILKVSYGVIFALLLEGIIKNNKLK
jgi:hypothetical protein